MNYKRKHANLSMKVLETIRQGSWHEQNYYFGTGYDRSILFSGLYKAYGRDLYESGNRLCTLHGHQFHSDASLWL